jgi:tetratricopeptide (TPR) repeat protein
MNTRLISKIEQFRKLGFFECIDEESNIIAERIIAESESSYFGNISNLQHEPLFEPILLSYDKSIAWFVEDSSGYDLSDEFRPELYYEVINQLQRISKGLFTPKNITLNECGYCDGRDKRIAINYTLNNIKTELVFCADGWALMLNFLEEVNESIRHSSNSFEFIIDPYGPCFIFFLSAVQKKSLSDEYGWKFISTPNYWADKAMYYKELNKPKEVESCFKKAVKGNNINTFVQYGIFLKEQNRHPEAIEIFKMGRCVIDEQTPPFDNREWWADFIDNQINEINKNV